MGKFSVEWRDAGKEPKCAPNPAFPLGIDLDVSDGAELACVTSLPYPAKRIGAFVIRCDVCGMSVGCTTAGRSDDPRSIKIPCKIEARA